jgi:hypothetical protein
MQQKSGHDLWPLFVPIGLVLKRLALRRVEPHLSVNNHSGYSRVRVGANHDVQLHIRQSRRSSLNSGSATSRPAFAEPTWSIILTAVDFCR